MGETWSAKNYRIKVNNKDKWVAVFGAGYNAAVNPELALQFMYRFENEENYKSIDIGERLMLCTIFFGIKW